MRGGLPLCLCLVPLAACSAPDLAGTNFSCRTDADCLGGKVCAAINDKPACVAPAMAPINVGLSAPLQGPSQELGVEMRRGVHGPFGSANRPGGARGGQPTPTTRNHDTDP